MKHLALCGMMASGKSYLAQAFSQKNMTPYFDLDEEIEQGEAETIQSIFESDGEASFRQLETQYLKSILSHPQASVIALGGGTIISEKNRILLKEKSILIYVKTELDALVKRLKNDKKRPLLYGEVDLRKKLEKLLADRKSFYESADFSLESSSTTKDMNRLTWIWNEYCINSK